MLNSLAVKPTAPTMSMSSSYGCSIFLPTTNKSFWSNPSFSLSQFLSIQSKPNKPHLFSCSYVSPFPLSLSFIEKKTKNSTFMCFVAEENNALFQEEEEENVMDDQEQGKTVGVIEEEWVPSEDCKIYVGNLPYEIHSEHLAGLFQEAGVVERVEVKYDRKTEQSRGFGFVSMHSVEEAERAVQMFNGYELNGRLLIVNKAAPRGTHPGRQSRGFDLSNMIYVGNLPWEVDNAGLMEIFSKHGKVMDARVVLDKESGKSRGFGFVTMSTKSELNEAISNLDGQIFNGRPIIVNVAKERPKIILT